ncbi:hypothetical protein AWRIB429_1826 [Oenococcus oeni AWRIB429]|uniref:Uncharacterized protein n=1 Tax=Oenococcus oeni AWRIB429 TaxID=655225 RepID=D3LBU6_OENOE|nr:hypothetical protein AWRIB429_1826 [Oenococcus oeni AWRIB429]
MIHRFNWPIGPVELIIFKLKIDSGDNLIKCEKFLRRETFLFVRKFPY